MVLLQVISLTEYQLLLLLWLVCSSKVSIISVPNTYYR